MLWCLQLREALFAVQVSPTSHVPKQHAGHVEQ